MHGNMNVKKKKETLTFVIRAHYRLVSVFPLISQRQYAATMQTSE